MLALAIEKSQRHDGSEGSWNQISGPQSLEHAMSLLVSDTMTYTLSSLDTRTHIRQHDEPADHNGRR